MSDFTDHPSRVSVYCETMDLRPNLFVGLGNNVYIFGSCLCSNSPPFMTLILSKERTMTDTSWHQRCYRSYQNEVEDNVGMS